MPLSVQAEQRKDATSARYYAKRKNLFTAAHIAHIGYIIRSEIMGDVSDETVWDLWHGFAKAANTSIDAAMAVTSTVTTPEFQHRHFSVIAAVLKEIGDSKDFGTGRWIALCFADKLANTNAKFDKHRFMHACGW